jgi:hypothetical protein
LRRGRQGSRNAAFRPCVASPSEGIQVGKNAAAKIRNLREGVEFTSPTLQSSSLAAINPDLIWVEAPTTLSSVNSAMNREKVVPPLNAGLHITPAPVLFSIFSRFHSR